MKYDSASFIGVVYNVRSERNLAVADPGGGGGWGGGVVSSPDPYSQQLRVDYITATGT